MNDNEIISYVSSLGLKSQDLDIIAPQGNKVKLDRFLEKYFRKELLLIDVRSEVEFEDSHIPGAFSIPLLNTEERHHVGVVYNSDSSAGIAYAYYLAQRKEQELLAKYIKLLSEHPQKEVVIYCFRGGGRSRYSCNLIKGLGLSSLTFLEGGWKSFRSKVHELCYLDTFECPLISLSGQTGVGKSEILEHIVKNRINIPTLHLEEAARHASSVFGHIRFGESTMETVSQSTFEANLFCQLYPEIDSQGQFPTFLSEKESRKIGHVSIPPKIFAQLTKEIHIKIISPIDLRIKRLTEDYFYNEEACRLAKESVQFLQKRLGTKVDDYIKLIDAKRYAEFLEDILLSYYDKVYKKTKIAPIAVVENVKVEDAICEIEDIFKKLH